MQKQIIAMTILAAMSACCGVTAHAQIVPVADDYTAFTYVPFNTAAMNPTPDATGSFSGSAAYGAGLINVTGTFSSTGSRAYNQGLTFSNLSYPEFAGDLPALAVNGNDSPAGSNPYSVFTLNFDQALPMGSFLIVSDVDATAYGEYALLQGLSSSAYLDTIGFDPAGTVQNMPDISFDVVTGTWTLLATGSNSPGDLNFFDISGLTSLTYTGGFNNPINAASSTSISGIEIIIPVPEPSGALLMGLAGAIVLLGRRRSA